MQTELLRSNSRLGSLIILSGAVHTKGESPQDGLKDVRTCWTTLALAYVLYCLSVKIIDSGLNFYFLFFILFYFVFFLFFSFLFLEQLGLGFINHPVTSVTSWWRSHKTDHRTWENGVEGSRIKWYHTAWTTHAGLMSYTWSLG